MNSTEDCSATRPTGLIAVLPVGSVPVVRAPVRTLSPIRCCRVAQMVGLSLRREYVLDAARDANVFWVLTNVNVEGPDARLIVVRLASFHMREMPGATLTDVGGPPPRIRVCERSRSPRMRPELISRAATKDCMQT